MSDAAVSAHRGKVFPRFRPDFVIEKVTRDITVNPYGDEKRFGEGGPSRKIPLSLPRSRFLEGAVK